MAVQNNTYANMQEEELKNKIRKDFFDYKDLDADKIIGKIDFCVSLKKSQDKANNLAQNNAHDSNTQDFGDINLLWAEAKRGKSDLITSFIQLILTIGKNKMLNDNNPPKFLGAFDAEKIAFIEFGEIAHIFTQDDFNWKVTPSDHNSKAFAQLEKILKDSLSKNLTYFYDKDEKELKKFISQNLRNASATTHKYEIDKNNFNIIYQKWLEIVKPTIKIDWQQYKDDGISEGEFYLADLLSQDNKSLKDNLKVVLNSTQYRITEIVEIRGCFREVKEDITFTDSQKAHTEFWSHYERPPKEVYWQYIIERKDLLVPLDIRERKGAFFTPQIWVQNALQYLVDTFGEDYQEKYYIWDCAAGTGNLVAFFTESNRVFASTLGDSDIKTMHDMIENNHLNLRKDYVFEFDFLNDDFFDKPCDKHIIAQKNCANCYTKVPIELQKILKDPKECEKLIIFINPPYAEAGTTAATTGTGKHKDGVATTNAIYKKYKTQMGKASNELYAQFFFRIYKEVEGCKLAAFSKLKYLSATNFIRFREMFKARFKKGFICPANTFDNVNGSFPIAFIVWDLAVKEEIKKTTLDVFYAPKKLEERALRGKDDKAKPLGKKTFYAHTGEIINKWMKGYDVRVGDELGVINTGRNDFQHANLVHISHICIRGYAINQYNLIPACVYLAVHFCIKATWLNDRDQFLAPKESWLKDSEFHFNCLVFSLFHGQNRISSLQGKNHFIPFTKKEMKAKDALESCFMSDFLQGKIGAKLSNSGEAGGDSDSGGVRDSAQNGGAGASSAFAGGLRGSGRNKESEAEASHTASDVKESGLESNESATQSLGCQSNKNRAFADKQEKTESKNIDSSLFESQNETLKLLINLIPQKPVIFSELAQKVMDAGRELFTYYHESASKPPKFSFDDGYNRSYNANVSLYDIKAHFQGFKNKKMNPPQKAQDEHYKILLSDLNNALENLADEIAQKCYEHEFLLD